MLAALSLPFYEAVDPSPLRYIGWWQLFCPERRSSIFKAPGSTSLAFFVPVPVLSNPTGSTYDSCCITTMYMAIHWSENYQWFPILTNRHEKLDPLKEEVTQMLQDNHGAGLPHAPNGPWEDGNHGCMEELVWSKRNQQN
eukprot:14721172-Ditylum_brightwellii.AAC.2